VISGTATILVCRTGSRSALGHLSTSLAEKPPATDFALGIRRFSMLIMRFTVALIVFVLAVNVWFARPILESVMFAVALAVGLTPELLPMIVTVTLARSAMQMAKRKVIVKRLSAIHDVGAMNVLCTDKTGTLTEAKIKLLRTIDGHGAESANAFSYAYVNSKFETGIKSPLDEAILAAHPFDMTGFRKIDEAPFDFERRRVSVLVEHGTKRGLFVKGAPEDILRLSTQFQDADGVVQPLLAETRSVFQATLDGLGAQGFRALGIASRLAQSTPGTANKESAKITDETDMVFAGFAVFLDPPKASAGATIRDLQKAGVTVKVVTGDNELVSRHVFAEIGVPVTGVLTGEALDRISDEALIGQLPRTNLFCRINPQQKHRILLALKRRGDVVGFMGDGRFDPAGTESFGGSRRRRCRARRGPKRDQVCTDGRKLEFRQHVQHGGRDVDLAIPADAADPDPAQQPDLQRFGDRDPVRQRRSGDGRQAVEVGHQADRALHACFRSGQLGLRFHNILGPAEHISRR
jgi:Mg2+-importing ATPase